MWNMAKFINFAALVGPSSLFSCLVAKSKAFVFNFTYHNYYLTNYRYTGLQYNYYVMAKKSTVANLYTINI
jgi:hypothetical protein